MIRKFVYFTMLTLAVAIAGFLFAQSIDKTKYNSIVQDFESKLDVLAKTQAQNIPLNHLTDFIWVEACFYGPYDQKSLFGDNDSVNTVIFKSQKSELPIKISRFIVDIESSYFKCYNYNAKISFYQKTQFFNTKQYEKNYFIISEE